MKFTKRNVIYLLLIIYIVFLLITFFPFFKSSSPIAGWDTLTHIYSNEKYSDNLVKGDYFFSDSYWFNGYSTYLFYPPLFFMSVSIINILSFNLLSVVFVYKLLSVILVFLFIYALYFLFNKFFEINRDDSLLFAITSSFLWLFAPSTFDYLGIGIASVFGLGEITNFLGIIIGLFLITYAKLFFREKEKRAKDYLRFILLFSLLLLSHVFSFLFFSFLVLFIFLQEAIQNSLSWFKKEVLAGIIVIFGVVVLCAFWLVPFLKNIAYSGAVKATNYFGNWSSILFLFSNNHWIYLGLFILFIFGIIYLTKIKQRFLIVFWIFSLLLCLNIISINFTIHVYRLFAYIYLFYITIALLGIYYLSNLNFMLQSYTKVFAWIPVICLFYLLIFNSFFVFNRENGFNPYYKPTIDNYSDCNSLNNMVLDINAFSPNMVYAEQQISYIDCYSSPHVFEYALAKNKVPSLLGLYTESTSTTRFVFFPLRLLSQNTNWLTPAVLSSKVVVNPDIVFDRLKQYNVDYIIANSSKLNYYLENYKDAELIKIYSLCDEFNVYKLNNQYEVIDKIYTQPFLVFTKNDKDWIITSQLWFESDMTYSYPLIRSRSKLVDINLIDRDNLSGIIISSKLYESQKNNILFIDTLNQLSATHKVFISNKADAGLGLKMFSDYSGIFNKPFNTLVKSYDINANVSNVSITDDHISFDVNSKEIVPVLIRKSYLWFWEGHNEQGKLDVYEYSPNFMLVYTTGRTELNYIVPIEYKLLFLFSLVSFIFIILVLIFKSQLNN